MKKIKNVFKAFPLVKSRSKSEPPPPPPPPPEPATVKNWNLSPEALAGLLKTLRYLNQYHCQTEGLFARAGNQLEIMTITRMIHNGKLSVNTLQSVSVYSLSNAVKNIFTLHAPVVPSKMYDRFMSPLANFELLMMGIPPSHQDLFTTLMKFLCNILANRQANTSISSLAATVGILVLRDNDEPMTFTDIHNSAELQARARTFIRMLTEYQEHQKAHDSSASPESTLPLVPPTVYSIQDRSVKITFLNQHSHPKPESEELKDMLGKYGTVNNVGSKDKFAVILFSEPTEAINCANDASNLNENFKAKYLGTLTIEQIKQNRADWLRKSHEAATAAAIHQAAQQRDTADESLVTVPSVTPVSTSATAATAEGGEEERSPARTPARMKQISVKSNLTTDSGAAPHASHVNDDVMEVSSIHSRSALGRDSPVPTSSPQNSPPRNRNSRSNKNKRPDDESSQGSYSAIHQDPDESHLGVIDLSMVSHGDGGVQQQHHSQHHQQQGGNRQSRGIPLPRKRDHSEDTYVQEGVGGGAAKVDRIETGSHSSQGEEGAAAGGGAGESGGWKSAQLTADALEAHEHSHRHPHKLQRSHSESTASSFNNPQSASYRIADSSSLLHSPAAALSPDTAGAKSGQPLFVATDDLLPMTPRLSGSRNNSITRSAPRDVHFSNEGVDISAIHAEGTADDHHNNNQQLQGEEHTPGSTGVTRLRSVRTIQVIESPKEASPQGRSFFRDDAEAALGPITTNSSNAGGGVLVTEAAFDLAAMHSMGSSRGHVHAQHQEQQQQQPHHQRRSNKSSSSGTVTTTVRGSESLVVAELKQRLQHVEALLYSQQQARDEQNHESEHNEEAWSNELIAANLRVHQLENENSELRDVNRRLKFELKVSASSVLSMESNKKAMELAVISAKDRAERESLSTILAQEKLIAVLERNLSEMTTSYQKLHQELIDLTQAKVNAVAESDKWKKVACGGVASDALTVVGDDRVNTSVEGIAMKDIEQPTTNEYSGASELNEVKKQAESEVQSYLSRLPVESASSYRKSYQEYHSTAVQLMHRGDLERSSAAAAASMEGLYEITTTTSAAAVPPLNRASSPLRIDVSTPSTGVKENYQSTNTTAHSSLPNPRVPASASVAAPIKTNSTAAPPPPPPPPTNSSSPVLRRQPAFSAPPLDVTAALVSLVPSGQKYSDQILSRIAEKHGVTPAKSPYDRIRRSPSVGATAAEAPSAAPSNKKGYLSVLDVYAEMGIDLGAGRSVPKSRSTPYTGLSSASYQVQSHHNHNRAQNELMNLIQSEARAYGNNSSTAKGGAVSGASGRWRHQTYE